ncbi:Fur family transcriptional regulator [Pseudovibrio sp. Tun.PSC04-5.I4]|uniref:Fur family transcriptional regulator n=1 Tax=Pseudovibrio sp. Tun.PSC04-5.I4 TaxID=1798213 RepID=UPI0008856841|nr:Fur family transcriptional regulator [Pseudovibrio sp. Tun.PSC04-5.I4]SDQ72543.1 Fur family transcriptional regulator, zinc uptake regulator [Pseudovibrio sp. Tun.PSC04-5.I4]
MATAELKLTKNQRLVLDLLCASEAPMSAYSILDQLRTEGLRAPLQVYRALDKLIGLGAVHRLESMNAFVACAHPACHSVEMVGFAICESCGKALEFADTDVAEFLSRWATANGFVAKSTSIEIKGTCSSCQSNPECCSGAEGKTTA